MFNLIPISLFIMSLGGIIYIISGHLSEFYDEEKDDNFKLNLKARFANYIDRLPLNNVKNQSLSLTQKFLHRIRLTLLKTDNRLMKLIGKISERDKLINGNGGSNGNNNSSDFWESFSKNHQDGQAVKPEIPASNDWNTGQNIEVKVELGVAKITLKTKKSVR